MGSECKNCGNELTSVCMQCHACMGCKDPTSQADRIAALEATERELREAVKVLGNRIRVGSELHEFMRAEYSHRDKDRKAMNRKRARMKTALFLACDEVDANPIAEAAVREAGR